MASSMTNMLGAKHVHHALVAPQQKKEPENLQQVEMPAIESSEVSPVVDVVLDASLEEIQQTPEVLEVLEEQSMTLEAVSTESTSNKRMPPKKKKKEQKTQDQTPSAVDTPEETLSVESVSSKKKKKREKKQ